MRRLAASVAACVILATVSAAGSGATAVAPRSISTDTPSQILSISMHAATAQKTVKVLCGTSVAEYGLSETEVTDIGPSHSTQTDSEKAQGIGTGSVTERYVSGVVYFNANAVALYLQFNVKNSKYANKWISVKAGQKDYAQLSSGMYTSALPGQLEPGGKLTKATVTYKGKSAVEISGSATATQGVGSGKAHLYVSTQAPYLPLGENLSTVTHGTNLVGSCTLSNWKLAVTVTAPASSTPINKTNL